MKKLFFLFVLIVLSGCVSVVINENGKNVSPIGKEFYTKINIWYENPDEIITTNYIKGIFLPVGTKVRLVELAGNRIKFVNANKDIFYNIVVGRKETRISPKELLERYLSTDNVMDVNGEFSKLTVAEQSEVKNGNIVSGMSRKAALMAYGYPSTRKTPSIYSDIWVYFGDDENITVTFRDDKVLNVKSRKKRSIFGITRETAQNTTDIKLGMSKEDVNKIMGTPNSARGKGDEEIYEYILEDVGQYWVTFKEGKVVQYGILGEVRASARKTNDMRLGMSKTEVIQVMGTPNSAKGRGDEEIFEYILEDAGQYWIAFKNEKVFQYGRAGDFDSAIPQDRRQYDINIKNN